MVSVEVDRQAADKWISRATIESRLGGRILIRTMAHSQERAVEVVLVQARMIVAALGWRDV